MFRHECRLILGRPVSLQCEQHTGAVSAPGHNAWGRNRARFGSAAVRGQEQ
jgi:hypothetical protein